MLPPNWAFSRIGEITLPVAKIDPQDDPDRHIAYIDISGIDNQANRIDETKLFRLADAPSRARQIVRAGDVLFSLVRPYLRNIAQVGDELDGQIASTGFAVLRPADGVDAKFLFFKAISREFVDSLSGEQYGVSYPAVKDAQVRAQPILLPPLNEQRRIVEKIETLFARLDQGEAALRHTQQLLARYRQSVLKAAVTGVLTADWRAENAHRLEHGRDLLARILQTRRQTWQGRGKYKEPAAPDTTNLPELPEGWVWCSTEQLADVQTGSTPKKGEARFYAEGTVPWITSTAVNDEIILEPQAYITDAALRETNAKVFPKGTLIVAMYGEGKTRGKVSILGIDAATNQACAALAMEPLPKSVRSFLKSFYIYNYEAIRMLSSGGVQPNLNLGLIKQTAIPLAPEEELIEIQRRIDEALEIIQAMSSHCQTELTRSAALRQSILKDAFAGKLVPQDPSDEPAADLLARIRASRPVSARKKVSA